MKAASGVDKLLLFTVELKAEHRYPGFCFLSKYSEKTAPDNMIILPHYLLSQLIHAYLFQSWQTLSPGVL